MKRPSPTLLVVDDNEMNRDMLSRRLKRHGYAVIAAADGREALQHVQAARPALVLLDIEMPGMSGLQVLTTLRQRFTAAELPVIMVTARQQSADVVEALGLGANDYVTKPIDLPIALARIQTQLSRQQLEAALHESEERYALAVRGANDGLWDWDLRTEEIYYSQRWKQMIGLDEKAVGDSPDEWFRRVHSEDVERLMAEIAAHVEGLVPQLESQHRLLHADGSYRWMLSRGVAVRDADGKAYRMAGSQTDVTEGKVFDPLTGLPNRVLFMDRLCRSLERTRRDPRHLFAVLFLDLDRFKLVNDSRGHRFGDRLLIAVAERLESSLRSADTVARPGGEHTMARLGGDEFTILLDGMRHVSDAVRVADRLQQALAPPIQVDGVETFVTASIGIAASATGYREAEELVRDADTAMHRAKSLGRARGELFDARMREQAVARLTIETDLRRAMERREFVLYYQPIVSLVTRALVGFEALIRWRHPERGLVPPGDFIPVAEETGCILRIGSWALEEACRQLRSWQLLSAAAARLTVCVNLSGRQFIQADLTEQVEAVLARTALHATSLKLEITESMIVQDLEGAVSILEGLKRLGVRIAIDDFGTGYSSLSYLGRFPVDSLKIDRSFVGSMGGPRTDIVRAIVDLAHTLGLSVIAEGIEAESQAASLREMHCEFGQGFLFAAPLPPAAAEALVLSQGVTVPLTSLPATGV